MDLTTIERVKSRLSLSQDSDDKIDAAITSAILAGEPAFVTRLCTKLTAASYKDKFKVAEINAIPLDGFVRLRTSAGFIQEDSLVVSYGVSLSDALSATSVIPEADMIVNLEKGWVSIPDSYIGNYVVASYDAGFDSVASVPEGLKEAATNHAIIMMSIHQMDDKKPELVTTMKLLNEQITLSLDGYLRTNVTALIPLR